MIKNRKTCLSYFFLLALMLTLSFFIAGCGEVAGVGTVTLAWQAPTTNVDGSQLIDLAGFKVYYGFSSKDYFRSVIVGYYPVYRLDGLPTDQTLYFAVKAYDYFGNESDFSPEVSAFIPPM